MKIIATKKTIPSKWIASNQNLFMKAMKILNHLPQQEVEELSTCGIRLRIFSEEYKDKGLGWDGDFILIDAYGELDGLEIYVYDHKIETNVSHDQLSNYKNHDCSIQDCINECQYWIESVKLANHLKKSKSFSGFQRTVRRVVPSDYTTSKRVVYDHLTESPA